MSDSPAISAVRCKRCNYDLRGLSAGASPECGGAFNLQLPHTYRDAWSGPLRACGLAITILAILPILHLLAVHFAFVWREPTLMHDALLHAAHWCGNLTPVTVIASFVLCMVWDRLASYRYGNSVALRGGGVLVVLIVGVFVLVAAFAVLDPFGAYAWYFD